MGKACSSDILSQVDYELGRYQDMAILNPRPEAVSLLKWLTDHGLNLVYRRIVMNERSVNGNSL